MMSYVQRWVRGLEARLFRRALHFDPPGLVELSLVLCGKDKIRQLNRVYRKKDKATDVLSFPIHEALRELDIFPYPLLELGDIYICKEVAARQAHEFGLSFQEEILHLATHGLLHLCGYDHEISESEEKLMEENEMFILDGVRSE